MRILSTKQVALSGLKTYPGNPRRGDVAAIKASLQTNGQFRALVVRDETREILAGNHSFLAMRDLGWKRGLVHLVECTHAEAKRIVLADNRTAELGDYDDQALAELLGSLDGELEGTGWDSGAVDDLLASLASDRRGEDTEPIEPPKKPRTKPGDLYVLGEHRLLCGDATVAADVEKLMGGGVAVLITTDPPYGVDYAQVVGSRKNQKRGGWPDIAGDALDDDALYELVRSVLAAEARTLFLWHGAKRAHVFARAMHDTGWELAQQIIWVKNALVFGGSDYQWRHEPCFYARRRGSRCHADRKQTTVWELPKEHAPAHPTQKPVELYEIPMRNHTEVGDVVYDPFAGSGTALIAAQNYARRAYLMEIDPGYCDVIVDRFKRHCPEKPVSLESAKRDGVKWSEINTPRTTATTL